MPEKEEKKSSEELVNVGETVGADIDFDDKGCLLYTSPSPRD